MNRIFKKGLALLVACVMCACLLPAVAAAEVNEADFDTIVTSNANGDSSYTKTFTTANGWTVANSAIQAGGTTVMNPQFPVIGPDNSHKAPCLNGKVSAPGKVTSPTLTGGISKLTMNYTKMFTDTKLSVTITITDLTTGEVYSQIVAKEAPKDEKYTIWTYEWVLEAPITGDFTIEVLNNCPSAATSNKDRLTILDLLWESAAAPCQHSNTSVVGAADAGCTTEGHTGKTVCTDCGETLSEGTTISALGHNEVTDEAKDPSCTENGLTAGKHCDRCNETLVAQDEVPALNHANTTVEGAVDAGCTTEGHTGKTVCIDCGATLSEDAPISALGHADADQNDVCDTCGESLVEEAPATGDHGVLAAVVALMMSAVALVVTKRRVA